jgi:hypothetical protein
MKNCLSQCRGHFPEFHGMNLLWNMAGSFGLEYIIRRDSRQGDPNYQQGDTRCTGVMAFSFIFSDLVIFMIWFMIWRQTYFEGPVFFYCQHRNKGH